MKCEICTTLGLHYQKAVDALHVANQHLRMVKLGTLQSALCRREVHDSLNGLIAADAELKAHRAWHIECLTALPQPHHASL